MYPSETINTFYDKLKQRWQGKLVNGLRICKGGVVVEGCEAGWG